MIATLTALVGAALAYAAGVRRAPRWRAWRSVAFAAGLGALGAALLAGDEGLASHMSEHVVLTLVAAPLLVLGAPHALAPHASARVLRRLRPLAWPPLVWVLFGAAMLVVHLTGVFDYALDHAWAHGVEHAVLFWTAVLFWGPVCAAPPAPRPLGSMARIAYLLTAMAPMGVVGALLMNASDPVYSHYPASVQSDAGAAMWVGGGYALVFATVIAAWAAMEGEERRQRARERYGAQGTGHRGQGGAG